MVYPAALDVLIGYGQRFQPMITIGEYTKLFLTIIVGLGLIFEMPILVFFLALMRVIRRVGCGEIFDIPYSSSLLSQHW